VAAELKKRLPPGSVFYDKDFTAQLARPNLDTVLQRIYLQNSYLIVVFFCADYEKKSGAAGSSTTGMITRLCRCGSTTPLSPA
jgi:hypothetical protein